jgi:periplasmic protein TonB
MADVSQLLESRRSRIGRWAAAALVVCGLHAGGIALAIMHQPEDDAWNDPAGGLTVDLAALPAPTPVNSEDVAHGPEQQYGKPLTEASKQVVEKLQEDIPVVERSPAPDPEVVLPKPRPDEKEQPQEEPREAAEKQVQQEEGEELTAAPPRVEAQPAPSGAKSEGQSASIARAQAGWMKGLLRELNRHKRVPDAARSQRGTWEATVAFTLDRAGQVVTSQIVKSCGVAALDEEALALLKRVRFPPAPDGLPGETFDYTLPIKFGVK